MYIRLFFCTFLSLCLLVLGATAQNATYPPAVERVLQQTPHNRKELEKAISYFQNQTDKQPLEALYFLIANMDVHYSSDYYWADRSGKRLSFQELDYPTLQAALDAFEQLKKAHPGIHPVACQYADIDVIQGDYLIEAVQEAFRAWQSPYARQLSFADFCEYLLPYRVSVEPLQNWRKKYRTDFQYLTDSTQGQPLAKALPYLTQKGIHWFANSWTEGQPREVPLPRLGPLHMPLRKKGMCEDIAALSVFVLRSQGIPVALDFVPYWATSMGSHFFNVTWDGTGKPLPFDSDRPDPLSIVPLPREPSKVLRQTYSRQSATLAAQEKAAAIPPGFLQSCTYQDVTASYWPSQDVSCRVKVPHGQGVVYAAVFNYGHWRASWWCRPAGDSATFTAMPKGVVYLPMIYQQGQLQPCGYPVAVGYSHQRVLEPDTVHRRTIHIKQQAGYLRFRPQQKYTLYYWDQDWIPVATQTASETCEELVFTHVPAQALLRLVPDYSQGKERPFSITSEGERIWW